MNFLHVELIWSSLQSPWSLSGKDEIHLLLDIGIWLQMGIWDKKGKSLLIIYLFLSGNDCAEFEDTK